MKKIQLAFVCVLFFSTMIFCYSLPIKTSLDWRIYLNHPVGHEIMIVGDVYRIFFATSYIEAVKIEYSVNSGKTWMFVKEYFPTDKSKSENHLFFDWIVPSTISRNCRVKITSVKEPEISIASDADFEIRKAGQICKIPLSIGNKWFYKFEKGDASSHSISQNIEKIWTIKDTTRLDDNDFYFRIYVYSRKENSLSEYKISDSCFIRQSGNLVTIRNRIGNFTHDFSKALADSFNLVKKWLLTIHQSAANVTWYSLCDSLGITYYDYWNSTYGWSRYLLTGVILNKVQIGEIIENYTVGIEEAMESLLTTFSLSQNYPNPFNPETTIEYTIPPNVKGETEKVTLKVYDVLGREVATLVDEFKNAGTYNSTFNTLRSSLSSGVYFYRLQAGSYSETKKLILMK